MSEKDVAVAFYNTLYDKEYLHTIIDKWIKDTCYRFSSITDFLEYWFDAWLTHAPVDFALNWNHENTTGCVCFFDIQHKKPKEGKKSAQEMNEFHETNLRLKDFQNTFCVSQGFLQSDFQKHKAFASSFAVLVKHELFTLNKLRGKHICLYKFKFNNLCRVDRIIYIVVSRLKSAFNATRPKNEHILFDDLLYKYTNGNAYFNGLFDANKDV
jgi:hypothetical protein